MATDEQAQRQKSPIDFANQGLGMIQNARNAQKAVATLQKAKKIQQTVTLVAANWELIAIGIIIAIIVALFLVIITTIMGGSNGGTPLPSPQPGSPPTQGQTLTCSSGDYASCLKQDFNIDVFGGSSSNLAKIYQAFAFAGQSKQYLSLLTAKSQSLRIVIIGSDPRVCSGLTLGFLGIIKLSDGACFNIPFNSFRYLMIHESGHVIHARNPRLFQSFPWTNLKNAPPDSACYDNGYLKSYALRCGSSCGINPKNESFAEAIVDSLVVSSNSHYGSAKTITNFPNDCPATYSWIKENVFGGYAFY
jgi:hypothetical protein